MNSLLCHLNSWRYNIVYLIFLQLIVREVHIQNLGYVWHALSVPIKMNLVSPHVSLVLAVWPRNMKEVRIWLIAQVGQFCDYFKLNVHLCILFCVMFTCIENVCFWHIIDDIWFIPFEKKNHLNSIEKHYSYFIQRTNIKKSWMFLNCMILVTCNVFISGYLKKIQLEPVSCVWLLAKCLKSYIKAICKPWDHSYE